MLAKRLSNNSLYAIACRSAAAVFLGDCQTQPRVARLIPPAQHCKQFIATAGGFVEHAAERRRIKEPVIFREPIALAVRQSCVVAGRRGGRLAITALTVRGLWRDGASR